MKIKYIAEDDLNAIKKNLSDVLKKVVQNRECTLEELFEKDGIIKESPMEIEEFELDMSQPKNDGALTDAENIKRIYSHMRFLSDSQASDERIWAAYTFSELLDYMNYRWPAEEVSDLKNRYLFGYSVQRSLFRNGAARLWWIGRFTYDNTRDDPFELTKFLCRNQDFIENICGRNIFNNPDIGLGTVSALYDADKNGVVVDREMVRSTGKYVNLLAGTYLLDMLDRKYIYNKVRNKLGY